MNDQQFDRVTLSLRKSWSRQGTRELREYVLGLQAQRDLLVQAVALLGESNKTVRNLWSANAVDFGVPLDPETKEDITMRVDAFLASIDVKVAAHQAQGTGAMPAQCGVCNNTIHPAGSPCPMMFSAADIQAHAQAEQPVVTAKFDTDSQAHVYKFGKCWNVACKDGNHSSNWATKEAAETWARENGYGIVSK